MKRIVRCSCVRSGTTSPQVHSGTARRACAAVTAQRFEVRPLRVGDRLLAGLPSVAYYVFDVLVLHQTECGKAYGPEFARRN